MKTKKNPPPLSKMNPETTITSRNLNIDPNACLDQAVSIEIKHKYDPKIGIVEGMGVQNVSGGWAYYTLNIRPKFYRLSLTSNARIFQQKTVPDIVAQLLNDQGIALHSTNLDSTTPILNANTACNTKKAT
ncbi:MAG: hypothetical protein L3J00_04470 [Thiomicrorhabdus sp.]|nr:hypothetical protein [Thiomicrorhabdus sp.]